MAACSFLVILVHMINKNLVEKYMTIDEKVSQSLEDLSMAAVLHAIALMEKEELKVQQVYKTYTFETLANLD